MCKKRATPLPDGLYMKHTCSEDPVTSCARKKKIHASGPVAAHKKGVSRARSGHVAKDRKTVATTQE